MIYDPKMNLKTILGLSDLQAFRDLKKVFELFDSSIRNKPALDLGANRGLYSLWLSRLGLFSKVYAFEPHPKMVTQLRLNIDVNHLSNVELVPKACADQDGKMEFILNESDHVSSLVMSDTEQGAQTVKMEVETVSLDSFFNQREKPAFIKMDIEGAGTLAIPALYECLRETRPLLYLESHSPAEDSAIGKLMRDFNYVAFEVKKRMWVRNTSATYPDPEGVSGNLILCGEEFKTRMIGAFGS